ncbi:hypothetical protein FEM48_Zijuj12G0111100 [Ziziphus jujuba var. spinosa]|uniref:Uncharacterized protein n=1 Tax=Ziziphus jujuba var. spinosa TaxID=714518 RepID=A0A978UCY5_ZIZJJ|nr:hypothetical protein FEM48_Zijuj12G0111100 [Ziziphus jujuba var. spinosa]
MEIPAEPVIQVYGIKAKESQLYIYLAVLNHSLYTATEARSSPPFSNKSNQGLMMQTAKQVLEASIKRQVDIGAVSKRSSPGGPDPHHH